MYKAPKKKYHCRANNIEVVDGVAYIHTKNDPSITIILDAEDVPKIEMYSWSAHPHFNGVKYICHRYFDVDGKWHSFSLASRLGYGHGWKHANKNVYDFRKVNMVKNDCYKYAHKSAV